ncbi:MAG: hypothetical protein WCK09_12030 [Bacteroidota bacterium]
MKNSFVIFFGILLLSGMVASCKKESKTSFPSTMYITSVVDKSKARMFTNKHEIFDTSAINRFVGSSTFFKLHTGIFEEHDIVTFESADTALFTWSSMKFSYTLQDNLYLFYSKTFAVRIDPLNRTSVLIDTSLKYRAQRIAVPAGTNLINWLTKEVRVARGNYTDMDLSVLSYKVSSYGGTWSGRLFNEFNEDAVSAYGTYDTMAVLSYVYRLHAR